MNDLFLRACRGEPTERRPVWIMRQAGRYLPEYRDVRARVDFLTLCRTPELVTEVTLQPVDRLGVDAAIVFADILLPLHAMGAGLSFGKGEGPRFEHPVRSRRDLEALQDPDPERDLGYVYEGLRMVRRELAGRVPLIGFGGTPWTLAAYLVEGAVSKSHAHLLEWSYRDPAGLRELLSRLARISARYLEGQIEAGAQALQLFDTWGGLLDARRWRDLALPSVLEVIEPLRGRVPLIYYVQGAHLMPVVRELPVEVLSVDWRVPLDEVRATVGGDKVLQGNLDPGALLGTPEEIERLTLELLAAGTGGGHVVNLGHGILQQTPPENALAFVEAVKRHSAVAADATSTA